MARRLATSRLTAALALALVIVIQSVVGAFAVGAAGGSPQLDAFGNPLCLNGPGHDGTGDSGAPGHTKLPDCCTFACSMFWPGMAAPADAAHASIAARIAIRLAFGYSNPILLHEQGYRPGNPRAPPLTM